MKNWVVLLIPIFLVVSIVLAFLPFWENIFSKIRKTGILTAQLRVNTPESVARIYLDNELKGETKEGTALISGIVPGRHVVKIERSSTVPNFYVPLERELHFEEGAEIEIQWIAGPTKEACEGMIRYFKKQPISSNHTTVNLVVYPSDAKIVYDGKPIKVGEYQIVVDDENNHTISVSREGFETKEINLKIENTIRQRNLDVVIELYLYRKPIESDISNI